MNLPSILTSDSLSLNDPKLPKLWFELSLFVEAQQDKYNSYVLRTDLLSTSLLLSITYKQQGITITVVTINSDQMLCR